MTAAGKAVAGEPATVCFVHTGNTMKSTLHLFLCLLAVASIFDASVAKAADEDLTSSMYLVFDPETGEFVEENDPDRVKQEHAAREIVSAEAAGQDATTAANADESSSAPIAWIASGVAALVLVGGGAVWNRKRKKQAA